MRTRLRSLTTLFAAAGVCAATVIWHRPPRPLPECTNTAPNTTQCETNGSSADRHLTQQQNDYVGWPGAADSPSASAAGVRR